MMNHACFATTYFHSGKVQAPGNESTHDLHELDETASKVITGVANHTAAQR